MRKRLNTFTLICDTCGKSISMTKDADVMRNNPTPDNIFDGWIQDYNITGDSIYYKDFLKDFCCVSCLKKGIEKHFNQYNHINKS